LDFEIERKTMKKLIGLCLVSALFLGFAGCGGRAGTPAEPAFEESEMPDPSETSNTVEDATEPKTP
jgi:hypothetical protein